MKHSTDQRAHQPTLSSSLLKSQQLYLTCNINNLIYFLAPLFLSTNQPHSYIYIYTYTHTHTHTRIHRSVCSVLFSYLCLQEMWATQHSIKTIFCTIDPTALVSPSCFFFFSSSWSSSMKMVFLKVLLLNDEENVRRWLRFIKSSRGKTVTVHTEMKWIARGETQHGCRHWWRAATHSYAVLYAWHTLITYRYSVNVRALAGMRERVCGHLLVPMFSCGHCWHCLHWVEKPCRLSGCHFELPPPQCHGSI